MSTTATETLKPQTAPAKGVFAYQNPDLSVTPEQRGFFAAPPSLERNFYTHPLRDIRTDSNIVKGRAGIDKHGFTVVDHESALHFDENYAGTNAEDVYIPEVKALVKDFLGVKAVLMYTNWYRRVARKERPQDPKFYIKSGTEVDAKFGVPAVVQGKTIDTALSPVPIIHGDFTVFSMQQTLRYQPGVKDDEAAKEVIAAVDQAHEAGTPYAGPRYAAFSIWRPIRTVKRDPLAVLDAQTRPEEDCVKYRNRSPAGEGREFHTEPYMLKMGAAPERQRWYWLPEQTPSEVLFIKHADSLAETDPTVAYGSPHCSPELVGVEEEEIRESCETRVIVIW